MFRVLFSFAAVYLISVHACEPSGPPNSAGACPPETYLGKDDTGADMCCDEQTTIEPTTLAAITDTGAPSDATTVEPGTPGSETAVPGASTSAPRVTMPTTSASACVDRLNTKTGVSDCPARAHLCNNPDYFDVMTRQCPKTCGRCSSVTRRPTAGTGTCVDLVNPRTGVSDCPTMANLCNDSNYITLMTTQCKRTCGRCTSATGTTTTGACVDQTNPATGRSDCPARRNLCNNSAYATLMRQQCPATCGFC